MKTAAEMSAEMSDAERQADREKRISGYRNSVVFKRICICGSMRFYDWMFKVAERLTLDGNIVLMPFVRKDAVMTDDELARQHAIEQALPDGINLSIMLDAMHRNKIDMCDEIVVCTNGVGYFGDSTREEIAYAADQGKTIRFEKDPSTPTPGEDRDDYK